MAPPPAAVQWAVPRYPGRELGDAVSITPWQSRMLMGRGYADDEERMMNNLDYLTRFNRGQGRVPQATLGDAAMIANNYHQASTCATITRDAVARVQTAIPMLDQRHAALLKEKFEKAQISRRKKIKREIPVTTAIALALQADQWVYQAQAKAAKAANNEVKKCRSSLAHRHKLSKAEKDERYLKRYGKVRLPKAQRTFNNKMEYKEKMKAIKELKKSGQMN